MSTYNQFPDDKELEDKKLLPLSYEYFSENPTGYYNCVVDFMGILIKSLNDDGVDYIDLKHLKEMRERFKRDK